jgi:hypothetical protein
MAGVADVIQSGIDFILDQMSQSVRNLLRLFQRD